MIPFDITKIQPRAWNILSRSFKSDHIASTYLFHGPEGCGAWPMAISLAALLNCENIKSEEDGMVRPCGECQPCHSIFGINFQGLLFAVPVPPHKKIDERIELTNEILDVKRKEPFHLLRYAKSANIPIDAAREIKTDLTRRAGSGIKRVVIFYKMEMMRQASADALLKLIEEPPPDTLVIMTSNNPDRLLPTIHSRAQKIKVDRISEQLVEQYLIENYQQTENRARLIARLSEGSMGSAIEMVTHDLEDDASGRAVGFMLFKALVREEKPAIVSHLNDLISARNKGEAESLLKLWQSLIRDCGAFAITGDESDIINIDFSTEIQKMSVKFSSPTVALGMAESIKITLADLGLNVHIPGALTALSLKLKSNLDLQG